MNSIEKWITQNNNVYYVDINEFSEGQMESINKLNNNFTIDKNYYSSIYPRVMVFKNKTIFKDFELKCTGFDCTVYDNIF